MVEEVLEVKALDHSHLDQLPELTGSNHPHVIPEELTYHLWAWLGPEILL